MRFIVMCRVSGGITGTRQAPLKSNGEQRFFETREEAAAVARDLSARHNGIHAVAFFEYWAEAAPTPTDSYFGGGR